MKRAFIFFVKMLTVFCIILIGIFVYGRYIEIKRLKVRESKITSKILPDSFHGFKVIHISDIHYGRTIYKKELKKIVNQMNSIRPDIVFFTGDLLDEKTKLTEKELEELGTILSEIKASTGKFAIAGEEDFKKPNFEKVLDKGGFSNLNDTYQWIYTGSYTPMIVSGISSNLKNKKSIDEKTKSTREAIDNYRREQHSDVYSILLMHEPDFIEKINSKYYHLILAGHSHGGQVNIPVIKDLFLEKGAKIYYSNTFTYKNCLVYISSGLGTNNFTFRFLNPPSFNFYRLTNK